MTTHRIIPLHAMEKHPRRAGLVADTPLATEATLPTFSPLDALNRPLRDLRVSVTDRCNFRCSYCMPKAIFNNRYAYLQQSEILSFEEITRLARIFLSLGVRKIRLTGGEPLLRKNLDELVKQLAALRTVEGASPDVTLTTNGALLSQWAVPLRQAGLRRLTVSLDSLSNATFERMNDVGFPVADVLAGIDTAQKVGFDAIKINMVVQRGVNDDEVLPMARYFYGRGMALRFIEYMDVGNTNGWQPQQVLASADVLQQLQAHWNLRALPPSAPGETAQRWGYVNAQGNIDPSLGELGLISSISNAFCSDCNRARLSTKGEMYTCLFAGEGYDLRHFLRVPQAQGGFASDDTIRQAIAAIWQARSHQYSALRPSHTAENGDAKMGKDKVEMSYIGG